MLAITKNFNLFCQNSSNSQNSSSKTDGLTRSPFDSPSSSTPNVYRILFLLEPYRVNDFSLIT